MTDTPRTEDRLAASEMGPRRNRGLVAALAGAAVLIVGLTVAVAYLATRGNPGTDAVADVAQATATSTTQAPSPKASSAAISFYASGAVTLWLYIKETPNDCAGDKQFADVTEGGKIYVRDSTDSVIAVGTLARGRTEGLSCVFLFEIQEVPAGKGTYRIGVGNHPSTEYPEMDVRSRTVNVTLGM